MSRSVKKNPYVWTACHAGCRQLKAAKRRASKIVRRFDEDLANGRSYRKLDDWWDWPNETKTRCEDPKSYRK